MVTTPDCPYNLGSAGTAWWSWAWSSPAAKRWDGSALYTAARRAQLEDEWASEPSGALSRELRELESSLGLGPKAAHGLGWKPVEVAPAKNRADELAERRAQRRATGTEG